jgi:sugar (pentulose or hexulose) kinase
MAETREISERAQLIAAGKAALGIELGSTRIKASLVDSKGTPLASGSYGWENQLINGIWSYDLEDAQAGLSACYADLVENVKKTYGVPIRKLAACGFSGMMHGYIVQDAEGKLLVPFRTWRNNITSEACSVLTELFNFAIPQRWSIAHLYQAILNGEEHVEQIASLKTLAGYIHEQLTGERVMGIGEASGMFPIDPDTLDYDQKMVDAFDALAADKGFTWKLREILPRVLTAGQSAGLLTESGAKLLDPSGVLEPGIPACPPEGDAGTGMAATNSVRVRTGNVSAGTSVFAMLVLEKRLSKVQPQIDIVMTPDGKPAGMAHSNNCTSDYDAWVQLFKESTELLGLSVSVPELYDKLLGSALTAEADAGELLHISYVSGEHVTGFSEGRPLFVRKPGSRFTIGNVMRSLLFTSLCALRTGLNILTEEEGVEVDEIRGHGGFFKTAEVGQRIMAAATRTPVSLPKTAGEGGAWGIALLAAFMVREDTSVALPDYLDALIADSISEPVVPKPEDIAGFDHYFARYHEGLAIEREAVRTIQ